MFSQCLYICVAAQGRGLWTQLLQTHMLHINVSFRQNVEENVSYAR